MALILLEFVNGIFSILFVVIAAIVGIVIMTKYLKHKVRTLLLMGMSVVLIGAPWWPSSISFILNLTIGENLSLEAYILIGNAFFPLFLILLTTAFTDMKYENKQKIVLLFFIVTGILMEIYLFYFTFTDPNSLGELQGAVDIQYKAFLRIYLILTVVPIIVVGVLIGLELRKSDNPENKIKGNFLILAFITLTIGAVSDAILALDLLVLILIRLFLISSAIEFYFGFILPDWLKKFLLKEK